MKNKLSLALLLSLMLALLISGAAISLSIAAMVIWPDPIALFAANVIFGVAQSLAGVTMSPRRGLRARATR